MLAAAPSRSSLSVDESVAIFTGELDSSKAVLEDLKASRVTCMQKLLMVQTAWAQATGRPVVCTVDNVQVAEEEGGGGDEVIEGAEVLEGGVEGTESGGKEEGVAVAVFATTTEAENGEREGSTAPPAITSVAAPPLPSPPPGARPTAAASIVVDPAEAEARYQELAAAVDSYFATPSTPAAPPVDYTDPNAIQQQQELSLESYVQSAGQELAHLMRLRGLIVQARAQREEGRIGNLHFAAQVDREVLAGLVGNLVAKVGWL